MSEHEDFIRGNTVLASPTAVPELRLYLATEITPLWEAAESYLEVNDVPPPYWAFAWAGGQAMARYVLDHPEVVAGRNVLDFAAGCGLGAIAAAKAGAARTVANEIDDFAACAIGLNARENGVGIKVLHEDIVDKPGPAWDLVMAGDICYEAPMAARVFAWLRKLAAEGSTVLMSDPGRSYLPRTGLLKMASYRVPTSLELEDRTEREGVIYRIVG